MISLNVPPPFRDKVFSPRLLDLSLSWMPGPIHTPIGLSTSNVRQSYHRQTIVIQEHFAILEETVYQALLLAIPRF